MKFTLSWLKEHLQTKADIGEIADRLTAVGLEVEEIIDRTVEFTPFTVAQIVEAEPHPNADKLRYCTVDNGSEHLKIVCGAPNARAGIKVVLASIGTVIPTNGMKIRKSKIRDVESCGMLCSASELGIGEDSAGIIELPEEAEVGQPFAQYMGLDDPLIEIAITPNRGDCLGVRGIARDLAAAGLGELKSLTIDKIKGNFNSPVDVKISNTEKSPMFVGRYISGVKNGESPDWLKNRLESIGLRPISKLVDITNFLTFDLGRPAHVYDAAKLQGGLVVRDAEAGEKLEALDEKTYELESEMTVIADDSGPVALGGIIGGMPTGCSDDTTDVFLEIALFDPIEVARVGRQLQIESDARYRFERGIDTDLLPDAAEIATKLILDLCGGEASELVIAGAPPAQEPPIIFNPKQVEELIGIAPDEKEIKQILQNLGFNISGDSKGLEVTPPSWRNDIEQDVDLIEEIVRIYGYDKLPELPLPVSDRKKSTTSHTQKSVDKIRKTLVNRGIKEAVTFSFMDAAVVEKFSLNANDNISLENPISSELGVMRKSILPNLVDAVSRNEVRGYPDLALFEIGPVFDDAEPGAQQLIAAGIRSGNAAQKNPFDNSRTVDIFDVKADIFALIAEYVNPENLNITRDIPAYYHPGRAGALALGKNIVGYFGELHPSVLKKMDVKVCVVGFELFIEKLPQPRTKKSSARPKLEISNYQAVERDFAFIVDEETTASDILRAVRKSDKNLIKEVNIFDIYTGTGVEVGKKSVALAVKLQPHDRTLTDKEIEQVSNIVVDNVKQAVGGVLRS